MDQNMNEVDTLGCTNGYEADYHDIQYTQDGGYILQAYGKQEIDLPQTEVIDTANVLILQEFDQNHNLIFLLHIHLDQLMTFHRKYWHLYLPTLYIL